MGERAEHTKRRLRLHRFTAVIIVAWFVVAAVMLWRGGDVAGEDWVRMGQRLTRHFGMAALLCAVFFFVFRRSSRAGNIAFCAALAVLMVPMSMRAVRAVPNQGERERRADIAAEIRSNMSEHLGTLDEEPPGEAGIANEWTEHAERLDAVAETVRGDERRGVRVIAALTREIGKREAAYLRLVEPFMRSGPYEFTGSESREELSGRARRADEVADAARQFAVFMASLPDLMRERLEQGEVGEELAERAVASFVAGSVPELRAAIVRTDEAFHRAGAEMIRFLHDHQGRWVINEESGWEVFDEDVDVDAYVEIVERYNGAIDEEEALTARLVEHLRRAMRIMEEQERRLRGE